jgi:hypothetical protein
MARQVGSIFLEGTVHGLTLYHSGDKWLVRRKSSLNRKTFLRRPCFANTRRNAAWFGSANQLASTVYSCIPKPHRSRDFYDFLLARAQQLIREGLEGPAVMARLVRYLQIVGVALNKERLAFFIAPEEQAAVMPEKAVRMSKPAGISPTVFSAYLGSSRDRHRLLAGLGQTRLQNGRVGVQRYLSGQSPGESRWNRAESLHKRL